MNESPQEIHGKLFSSLKRELSVLDPVAFAENNLVIDGKPFEMTGNGWKFMADVYREVAAQATSPNAKPMVILKGRQVGATVLAAVLSLYFTASGLYGTGPKRPPIRVLHVFPTLSVMSKYAKDKLSYLIQNSQDNYISNRSITKDPVAGKAAPEDTLTEKTFLGFNKLRVDSVGRDADRLRGLSQDVLMFDEIQDISQQAVDNALRILTSAQYGPPTQGVQLYFGTPKQAGSYFWDIWNESDQRYFKLRCIKCGHYFFLYTIGNDEWKKIWIEKSIVECTNCFHRQEKRDAIEGGKWVATKEGPCKYIGYHMNVLLNPIYTKEAVLQYDPDLNNNRSRRAWENETLGNFYSTSNLTLTMDELRTMCCDPNRALAKEIVGNSDKVYVMGIDWGDKVESEHESRGKSYTVIVILSVDNNGAFTVENAWRLANNEFQYKINVIEHLFAKFKIRTAAADYMWGNNEVNHMQNMLDYGSRFLGCINSGNVGQVLTYKPKEMRVIVNKDQMIDEMFSLFRKGKIQFPSRGDSFDRIYWLLEHCVSMELTTAQRYGSAIKKYEKGIGPNDGLMALMYAVIAYKFLATNGFRGADERRDGPRPMPLMAFIPRMK